VYTKNSLKILRFLILGDGGILDLELNWIYLVLLIGHTQKYLEVFRNGKNQNIFEYINIYTKPVFIKIDFFFAVTQKQITVE